jgi:predicted small lipoprotein YifL
MKKIIPIFLSVVLLLMLSACGSTGTTENNTPAVSETSQTETEKENGNSSAPEETPDASEPDQESVKPVVSLPRKAYKFIETECDCDCKNDNHIELP